MGASLKYLLFILVTATLLFIAWGAHLNEQRAVTVTQQLCTQNDTSRTLHRKIDQLLESLTAGLYGDYSRKETERRAMEAKAETLHGKSITYLYYFYASFLLFLLLFYLLDTELMILFIGVTALISLLGALFTPLVVMRVANSFPVLGEVTLSCESKTLLGTITKLFAHADYLIGVLVLLFSVLIPLFKSLLIIMYGFFRETGFGQRSVRVMGKIGKWSMADVFIVALLVVLFSTKQDIHTTLRVETGLYFFVGYVLLSMLGSSLLPGGRKGPDSSR